MKTNILKKMFASTLIMVFIFMTCGCNVKEPVPNEATTQEMNMKIIDQSGRLINLKKPAEKIVSCYYVSTYACIALGIEDRLIAVEDKAENRPIYEMSAPEILDVEQVGPTDNIDVDLIKRLNPDLVLVPEFMVETANKLVELEVQVLIVNSNTPKDMRKMLTVIAEACDVSENADKLISFYDEKLEKIDSIKSSKGKPSAYFADAENYLMAASDKAYEGDMITSCGAINIVPEDAGAIWHKFTSDELIEINPYVIIIPHNAKYTKEDILNDERLSDLRAVKNNWIYQMPKNIEGWNKPVPSYILGYLWTTSVLYPKSYPFDEFIEDASEFYRTFYGFELDISLLTR